MSIGDDVSLENEVNTTVLEHWRDYFFTMLNRAELDEVRSLASFIANGVLIGDKVVIDLVTLFSTHEDSWRALDPIAKEERVLVADLLTYILSMSETMSYLSTTVRNLDFTFRFLMREELPNSKVEILALTISSDPVCTLILVSNNNRMTHAFRLVSTESSVEVLSDLEALFKVQAS